MHRGDSTDGQRIHQRFASGHAELRRQGSVCAADLIGAARAVPSRQVYDRLAVGGGEIAGLTSNAEGADGAACSSTSGHPKYARNFGADTTTFRLRRADLSACR
jgi:hypothetical protein